MDDITEYSKGGLDNKAEALHVTLRSLCQSVLLQTPTRIVRGEPRFQKSVWRTYCKVYSTNFWIVSRPQTCYGCPRTDWRTCCSQLLTGQYLKRGGQEGGLVTNHRDLKHKITNHRVFK